MEEEDFFIQGLDEKRKLVEDLSEKLVEARGIAHEIASTCITIDDKRQKDIIDFKNELRQDFISNYQVEPSEYFLVAKCGTRELHICLNMK
ncbi:hypothetical protein [Halalkalibacter sp. APA_J-10(15)]|uniref:hypothetical protein n=1 Tax=Halalkalibacter sp. APA_J-10(15) TaxID=2933805 RepID=UPI001FF6BCF7|nr:hypothetical protein [Halalkalibacter sp. APA_J-10(15)]MCK0471424.1 hypothetical protein [Halalkalibacter sp. APA_J-10(15)]